MGMTMANMTVVYAPFHECIYMLRASEKTDYVDLGVEGSNEWNTYRLEYFQSHKKDLELFSAIWSSIPPADRRQIVREARGIA